MTTSAVVWAFLFIHLGVILVATAYFATGAALAPALTGRARDRFAARPWLPVLVGLGLSLPWIVTSLVLLNAGAAPVKLVGAILGCLWILAGLVGAAGVAQHIGRFGAINATWVHTVRGGLLITLTWVLPLVGWLGMLPLTLFTGVGCLALGMLGRGPSRSPRSAEA